MIKKRKKGYCYKSAADAIVDMVIFQHTDPKALRLVHGRPTLTVAPYCQYGHAWIEINEALVIDTATGAWLPRAIYYDVGKIDSAECFYYTFEEAKEMLLNFGHYGPWQGPEAVGPLAF
jgi:hypothetical protein